MKTEMVRRAARGCLNCCLTITAWMALTAGCAESSNQAGAQQPESLATEAKVSEAQVPQASSTPVESTASPEAATSATGAKPSTPADLAEGSVREPNVVGESVTYEVGGKKYVSYVAYDSGLAARRPGILVVPEWWGQNEYVRMRTRQLAAAGYVAIAVDMYGDGKVTTDPAEAQKLSSSVYGNLDQAQARFVAAKDVLQAQRFTSSEDISAIGYCFGGGISLSMARRGVDLDGVASFHGNLATDKPAKPGAVKAKLLVLTGDADPMVPQTQVEAFKKEMAAARVNTEIFSYPGAMHAFTNPEATELGKKHNLPVAYNADADAKSWAELIQFLSALYPSP